MIKKAALGLCMVTTIAAGVVGFGQVKCPNVIKDEGIFLSIEATFNPAYKTRESDKKFKVIPNKYVSRCWARIKEGSYNEKRYSKKLNKKMKAMGYAKHSCFNNPFQSQSLTYGWEYQ